MVKPLPEGLPPLPEGAVLLGWGTTFRRLDEGRFLGWVMHPDQDDEWIHSHFVGHDERWVYAAPADSEIARLNGYGKPSWDTAPDWAEWLAQDADGSWYWYRGGMEKDPYPEDRIFRFSSGNTGRRDYKPAGTGQPNPNWRETLERRPEPKEVGRLHLTIDASEARQIIDDALTKAIHGMPDLVIPMDALNAIGWQLAAESAISAGYRVEIDSTGLRGWKGGEDE